MNVEYEFKPTTDTLDIITQGRLTAFKYPLDILLLFTRKENKKQYVPIFVIQKSEDIPERPYMTNIEVWKNGLTGLPASHTLNSSSYIAYGVWQGYGFLLQKI
jgi:hypothetical protein